MPDLPAIGTSSASPTRHGIVRASGEGSPEASGEEAGEARDPLGSDFETVLGAQERAPEAKRRGTYPAVEIAPEARPNSTHPVEIAPKAERGKAGAVTEVAAEAERAPGPVPAIVSVDAPAAPAGGETVAQDGQGAGERESAKGSGEKGEALVAEVATGAPVATEAAVPAAPKPAPPEGTPRSYKQGRVSGAGETEGAPRAQEAKTSPPANAPVAIESGHLSATAPMGGDQVQAAEADATLPFQSEAEHPPAQRTANQHFAPQQQVADAPRLPVVNEAAPRGAEATLAGAEPKDWRLTQQPLPVRPAQIEAAPQQVQPQAVAAQITLAVDRAKDRRIEIRLDPPELGRVQIQLNPTERGLQAIVLAERPETGDLLRRHADVLTRDLREAGYEGVTLDVATGHGDRQQRARSESLHGFVTLTGPAADLPPQAPPVLREVAGGLDIRL